MRFLWVDTLCILQDSPEDKAREIEQMAHIYSGASFALLAASSERVSQGFLQPRRDLLPPDAVLPPFCFGATHPGTLYLSDQAMQYHCATAITSIRGGVTARTAEVDTRLPGVFFLPKERRKTPPPPQKTPIFTHGTRRHWWVALNDYSARATTLPSDKLVATSGVAQHLNRVFQMRHLAGLWEDTLLDDLLWYTTKPLMPRPKTYRALT
ncbi:hypothetical protein HGRIS_001460 [Hohenbuehelia grisea]|uniref:Heterokaryon incompatibility domain-containing protein n=1 Tax=Hohenbuehelia grisea TaxID=104357 RepID=A0ABR3JPE4_9AGAR